MLSEPNFDLVVFCFIGWWGNYPSNMAHSGGSTDENSKVNVEETKNNWSVDWLIGWLVDGLAVLLIGRLVG